MSTEVAIIKRENVELIASTAPQAYSENQVSRQRCLVAGNTLLATIQQQGMNNELDQQAASFIEKARKTVKKMYDKRSPLTKMFDEIRTNFTSMESDVDPTKKDSVPYQLQQLRNEFAVQKRRQEEERRRTAMKEQQKQASIAKYRTDLEEDYRRVFNGVLNGSLNKLMGINAGITLDNIQQSKETITNFTTTLDETPFSRSMVLLPTNVSSEELANIRASVLNRLIANFRELYSSQITKAKQEYITMLPSKEAELKRAAQAASDEEAERIKREIKEREETEAAKKEQERIEREKKEAAELEMKKQQSEMGALFNTASVSVPTYQPKTAVKKKLVLLNPEGIMPVLSMWWTEEGCKMTVEELTKMFKKQITYCEKRANDKQNSVTIADESVSYEEEVKAK
jgi:hypothetical protein